MAKVKAARLPQSSLMVLRQQFLTLAGCDHKRKINPRLNRGMLEKEPRIWTPRSSSVSFWWHHPSLFKQYSAEEDFTWKNIKRPDWNLIKCHSPSGRMCVWVENKTVTSAQRTDRRFSHVSGLRLGRGALNLSRTQEYVLKHWACPQLQVRSPETG